MMLHIANVLTASQVQALRQEIDAGPWSDGRASVGEQGALVKHNRQLPVDHPMAQQAGHTVLAALQASPHFFAATLPLKIGVPLFNRYEGGETYGLHVDGAVRHEAAGWLRTDVSCTVFLSQPDSYEGGELEVVDTYGAHQVKLPAGDVIVYPSSSLHQVLPVTRGVRVSAVLWLQSMVRDDGQRHQIYELDQAIQSLRTRYGDGPEVLTLTNHYHNMLRLWSDT